MCTAGDTGFNLRSGDAVAAPVLGPWLMGTSCALSTSGAPPDGPMQNRFDVLSSEGRLTAKAKVT
eukprot:CAMPEP_0174299488 /NCGR_PEP_ID=MMETSP0809-20121228/56801_1 /TAXON_ID=73025 ORGANISM="Eutreptiella gymnastica-like, Strain CCMP1594" /NCGR_SAMPLE_ID=MMETSP0809 /ASSEMBLY_ACC=CAM_ASM_000658 /LENGTH=64 /DNA_ID=CAMNT_0015404687 /DNA_START=282 /DNA_END=477 /DNA_ORIENTATION=-